MNEDNNYKVRVSDISEFETYTTFEMTDSCISFEVDGEKLIELKTGGEILVKGSVASNDKDIVDSMRKFVNHTIKNMQ